MAFFESLRNKYVCPACDWKGPLGDAIRNRGDVARCPRKMGRDKAAPGRDECFCPLEPDVTTGGAS